MPASRKYSVLFLTGMKLSFDIASMGGPNFSTPRGMGAFVLALKPEAFLERANFDDAMRRYVDTLRGSAARDGARVMAPGDREWQVAAQRVRDGVALDPATRKSFADCPIALMSSCPLPEAACVGRFRSKLCLLTFVVVPP